MKEEPRWYVQTPAESIQVADNVSYHHMILLLNYSLYTATINLSRSIAHESWR